MYSAKLESFSKKDFLNMVRACSELWETDAFYSGTGFGKEDVSVCCILPVSRLSVSADTTAAKVKEFVNNDDKEVFGYLAYDFGMVLRGVVTDKNLLQEQGILKKYAVYCRHKSENLNIESDNPVLIEKVIQAFELYKEKTVTVSMKNLKCSMTRDEYVEKVRRVIEYIKDGHTYQLNLSMKYEAELDVEPFSLWTGMAEKNPAPFYGIFKTTDGHILSTSPERFLKVDDGKVLSQHIKGTLRFDEYSQELDDSLKDSVKESAELSMIVDLIRNDISADCQVGSVEVQEHKSVMRVDNLLQMFSSVTGILKEGSDVVDLLFTAFPGGSVTGCPKKRSMELIDSLEPHTRGVYCGSLVRIKNMTNMDSSISIRTGFLKDGVLSFYAGSGIVADSVPENEYEESVSKAEKFLRLIK